MPEFRRPYHRAIGSLLASLDPAFLESTGCYFAGGTQIALALGEYRESRDVDFLCASRPGFRRLRETVTENSLGPLLRRPLALARPVRADRDGIRTFLTVGDARIKFEIVLEGRIDLAGRTDRALGIPVLDPEYAVAEKLLANTDRGLDDSTKSRDLVDLAFLVARLGREVLPPAIRIAEGAYGAAVSRYLVLVLKRFSTRAYAGRCARALGVEDMATLRKGVAILRAHVARA